MRPQPSDDPAIQLVEALSDLGAAVVVAPSSDDRVDCFNQLSHAQGYSPLRQASDLILESVQRLLSRNGVEIMPVQLGCDPVAAQLQSAFAASDLKSEKLKALGNVHDPGFFPVERHAKFSEDLCC